jgi:RNA polymerase-binding transcription factor DksA
MAAPKPAPKKVAKPIAKPAAKKPVVAAKPVAKAPAKKVVPAKPAPKKVAVAAKPAPKKAAVPAKKVIAPPAKSKVAAPKPIIVDKPKAKAPIAAAPAKKAPAAAPVAKKAAPAPAKKPVAAPAKTVAPPAKKAAPAPVPVPPPVVASPSVKAVHPLSVPPPPVLAAPLRKKEEPARTGKIVIPKTTIKTSVKFEPDFTKSILDPNQEPEVAHVTTMRYSDGELIEFRDLINRKLDAAKKELSYLQGLITRKDELGGDNDDARYMTMEDGSLSMEREQLSQMASRQITFVDHLEKALRRIESKTYGVCRVTGKLIDKARLRAVPHATLSMEAKTGKVK